MGAREYCLGVILIPETRTNKYRSTEVPCVQPWLASCIDRAVLHVAPWSPSFASAWPGPVWLLLLSTSPPIQLPNSQASPSQSRQTRVDGADASSIRAVTPCRQQVPLLQLADGPGSHAFYSVLRAEVKSRYLCAPAGRWLLAPLAPPSLDPDLDSARETLRACWPPWELEFGVLRLVSEDRGGRRRALSSAQVYCAGFHTTLTRRRLTAQNCSRLINSTGVAHSTVSPSPG